MELKTQFGKRPNKKQRAELLQFSNYENNQFQNQLDTPSLAEGETMLKIIAGMLKKYPDTTPSKPIPAVHTDLNLLKQEEEVLIWFGHSSYFIRIGGINFLIDPVFSGNASPIPGSLKAFPGSNNYQAEDMPFIDYLLITHDHWDHLDYPTIQKLKSKTGKVICGIGVANHFKHWKWETGKLIEKNWYDRVELTDQLTITLTPARHFSGRTFRRNTSLWTSYIIESAGKKLFLGGDSGYSSHFKELGDKYGPFDLAVLECGQYNKKWPYIHSFPDEIIQEVKELNARFFLPVHHSKFKLSQHSWYEPIRDVTKLAEEADLDYCCPKIGEKMNLNELGNYQEKWWEECI